MKKVIITVASIALLSGCSQGQATSPAPSFHEGTPFMDEYIKRLTEPPTSQAPIPTSIGDLLLPPSAR